MPKSCKNPRRKRKLLRIRLGFIMLCKLLPPGGASPSPTAARTSISRVIPDVNFPRHPLRTAFMRGIIRLRKNRIGSGSIHCDSQQGNLGERREPETLTAVFPREAVTVKRHADVSGAPEVRKPARIPRYYPLIKPFKSFRPESRHASLLSLTIYFHYALRKAPRPTQFCLGKLMKLLISE